MFLAIIEVLIYYNVVYIIMFGKHNYCTSRYNNYIIIVNLLIIIKTEANWRHTIHYFIQYYNNNN